MTAQSQLLDNYSNSFDESGGGFLGEGMTMINERSTTEQSINVNYLMLMWILGSGGRSWRETTDGLDDHAMNLKQRLEAMRETEDDGSSDVNGFVEQMERARAICNKKPLNEEQTPSQDFSTTFDLSKQLSILNPLVQSSENVTSEWKRDGLEEILVESILEKVEAKRKRNNMLATTSTTSVVAKDQTQNACLQLEGNSKLKKISIEKTVVRTDGYIPNQLNQDQSKGDVNKMRTTAPLTSWVTFEKPRSLPPPSSLLRPRKTMPNLGSQETPAKLSLATAKKTSSKTSLPPNSSSAVQKPGSTTSTANTITRTTRLEKRILAPLSLNSNASRPPFFDTSIKKPKFMATATTISRTGKIPSSRGSDAMLLSKPTGLGAKKTKLKPSTKDCGKNSSPRVLKTRSSISSELINPSIGSSINSRLAKRESLVVSKATIPSSIKSSASPSTLVKKGTTINVEKSRLMIEIKSRRAMARTGENKISYFTIPPWGTYLSGDITHY
ncbi:hypothetical protein BY996DRAFT_8559678 [Phakopsora pachyrhizi]|nr:hypothetical protein BY996DRAFT_8559678 [Phakopsora pachyrhizi]